MHVREIYVGVYVSVLTVQGLYGNASSGCTYLWLCKSLSLESKQIVLDTKPH